MDTDTRPARTSRRGATLCRHGLPAALNAQGQPRCPLCRRDAGQPLPTVDGRRAETGRCTQPGHEPYKREHCPACAGDAAAAGRTPTRHR